MSIDALKDLLSKLSPAKRKLLALELLGTDTLKPAAPEPIAIVGMSCRFPGGANDPEAYWRLLREARNGMSEVPSSRWDLDAYYDADPDVPGKMYVRESGFLRGVEVSDFDAQFFGIAPPEAESLDPQQRLLLEVAWEALEHAGQAPGNLVGSRTGVFVGVSTNDYMMEHLKRTGAEGIDAYWFSGTGFSVAAGRISYVLGLQGPAMAVDTMCSSSLVVTQLACQHLREKRCDMALVGGVNVMVNPEFTVYCCKGRFVAADGRCKTFDVTADGYARGEGCGVLVMKRLSDALEQNDSILAVVRGTAVNEDGRSSSLTAPNGMAQRAVIREALGNASLTADAIGYAEAHGTGTPLGDPIELQSLASVLTADVARPLPLPVGAVKTNVGHLEAGAGMASMIKVILCLHHGEVVPNLNMTQTNPDLGVEELKIMLPTERRPWSRKEGKRYAGISAFAFQGTNAHVVLEEPPQPVEPVNAFQRPLDVLTLSARSPQALQAIARRYAVALRETTNISAADICFTANTGRSHFARRVAILGRSVEDLAAQCARLGRGDENGIASSTVERQPTVAMTFSSGSAVRLDENLAASSPVVWNALAECREAANAVAGETLDVARLVTLAPATRTLSPAATAIIELSAIIALQRMWSSFGVKPEVVSGAGLGEITAAVAAQSITVVEAMRVAVSRARHDVQALRSGSPIDSKAPRTLMVSSKTGEFFAGNSSPDSAYWASTSGVIEPSRMLAAARRHGCALFLDVTGAVGDGTLPANPLVDWRVVSEALAKLYVGGCSLDWAALDAGFKRRKVRLPTYAFQRRRFWFEAEKRDVAPPAFDGVSSEQLASSLDLVNSLSDADLDALLQN